MNSSHSAFRVLFVCMGNICRSPIAEAVLRKYLAAAQLSNRVLVASAATHGYHVGESADALTRRAAKFRGYDLSVHRARKIARQDLDYFNLILAMDNANLENLYRLASPEQQKRIRLFMDYSSSFPKEDVPDPVYSLSHTFDLVLDMLEDATTGLIDVISESLPTPPKCYGRPEKTAKIEFFSGKNAS